MEIYANYLIKCCRQQNTFSIDQCETRGVSTWPFMVSKWVHNPFDCPPRSQEGMDFGYDGPAEAAETHFSTTDPIKL